MNDSESDLNDYEMYTAGEYLWKYGSPLLIAVGTFGNILSIIVLLRSRLRRSTTMFYLTCLSFGDLFTLYTGLLRYWIRSTFDIDIRNLSDTSCKIHTFVVYLSLDFTVWVLVSVTVDRCLSVSMPFKAKLICSLTRSKCVIFVIWLLLVMKNMHFLWNLGLVDTWEFRCDGRTYEIDMFLRYVWPWIDFSTFCLIPFGIMIVCNIKIIYEIVMSQKKISAHRSFYRTTNHPMNNANPKSCRRRPSEMALRSISAQDIAQYNGVVTSEMISRQTSQTNRQSPCRRISSLTAMLLTVNCVFLVTTSPIQAFLIGEEYWFPEKTQEEIAWHNFWWAIVNLLQYVNNAIHFFLYCMTGPRFRNELKSIFKRTHTVAVGRESPSRTGM